MPFGRLTNMSEIRYYPPSQNNIRPQAEPARPDVYLPIGYSHAPRRRPGGRAGRTVPPALIVALSAALSFLAVSFLAVSILLGVYGYYQVSERILPGVNAGSSQLGGKNRTQAAIEIHKTWNLERRLAATDGMHTASISLAEVGLSVDPVATAANAYSAGHGQSFPAEMQQMLHSVLKGWGVAPVVRLDAQQARQGLQALAAQMSQAPQDATLRLENGQLTPVPSQLGYTINVEDTLAALEQNPLAVVVGGRLEVRLMPVPPRITDVSAAMAEAQRLLASPVSIQAYDPITDERLNWPVSQQAIAEWLKVEPGEAGPQVILDPQKVAAYLTAQGSGLGGERWIDVEQYAGPLAQAVRQGAALPVILKHHPTKYTVQPGDTLLKVGWKLGMPYWRIINANPGINPDALIAGQELTIPSKDDLLPLPVVANKRIVISISEQRLWTYQDGQLLKKYVISTGINRSPTQPGVFQVLTHDIYAYASVWDLHMPHFLSIYEAWPGFQNGIHGLPTLANGQRLWANILGRPASYGCIILDLDAAETVYNWAEDGVVVQITP